MQYLKNILNYYIKGYSVHIYLLITIGLTTLLWLGNSFWQPKLNQLTENKFFPQKDWFYFLLICFISLLLFAVHACIYGFPLPTNGDEYCYLLMAKTFAEGRITNPQHPLWQFFDNFHLLNEPTYTGKYPPAQAAFLAIGIVLFNHPVGGVWLSGALAAVACFWMLRAFFSLNWSLLGALLFLTHPTIFNWNYGYYYGNVGLIGGALCIGSLFRLIKKAEIKDAVVFAVGMALLANSRPFEGLLVCLPLTAVIIYWIGKRFREAGFLHSILYKLVIPVSLILVLNFVWMAYYNWRVTGDALKLPYSLFTAQYDPVPLFLPLLSPPVPDQAFRDRMVEEYVTRQNIRNPIMKDFHINEIDVHYIDTLKALSARSGGSIILFLLKRMIKNFIEFLYNTSAVYLIVLLFGIYVFRLNKKYLFFTGAFFFCLFLEGFATYNQNHYYAPFVPFLFVAVTAALATAHRKSKSDSAGKLLISFSLVLLFLQSVWLFCNNVIAFKSNVVGMEMKTQVVFQEVFYNLPGKHLVVIDYSTGNHQSNDGRWVIITSRAFYNEPDIDWSKVVWANSLGEENNRQLFDYFKDRYVWVLGFESVDPQVRPKILSCNGLPSDYEPSAELKTLLRNYCPEQKEP